MTKFAVVIFTSPTPVVDETIKIEALLKSGSVDMVHLRKPEYNINQLRELLKGIDSSLHRQIRIHSYFELMNEFDLNGVHLNSRWSDVDNLLIGKGLLSRSCHSLAEVGRLLSDDKEELYRYVTLSPVFDSVSKQGYVSGFSEKDLRNASLDRVIALGGVVPASFGRLKELGFDGAALLGYVWNSDKTIRSICNELSEAKSKIIV